MLTNYHTHTWRCKHAEPNERAYIECAIENGYKILGFSDHTPYPFDDGYCSGFRMECSRLEEYSETLHKLKDEYKNDIEIHIGFEAEYYPKYFEKLRRMINGFGIEYFIMGQHFTCNERDGDYSGYEMYDDSLLVRYVEQTAEGLATGAYSCFAHPDLIHYLGNNDFYVEQMTKLCENAKALDIPLEYNLLGLEGGRNYPNGQFWEIAAKVGVKTIIGCDAHAVNCFAKTALRERAVGFLSSVGITPIEVLKLNNPQL